MNERLGISINTKASSSSSSLAAAAAAAVGEQRQCTCWGAWCEWYCAGKQKSISGVLRGCQNSKALWKLCNE